MGLARVALGLIVRFRPQTSAPENGGELIVGLLKELGTGPAATDMALFSPLNSEGCDSCGGTEFRSAAIA
jgi:hypothetical protein